MDLFKKKKKKKKKKKERKKEDEVTVLVRRTPLRKSLRATIKNYKVATGDYKERHVGTTVGQTLKVATSDYKE